jgi:hypothetical protein
MQRKQGAHQRRLLVSASKDRKRARRGEDVLRTLYSVLIPAHKPIKKGGFYTSYYPPWRVREIEEGSGRYRRLHEGEDCDSWVIFYPSQPSDDDIYIVYWDKEKRRWLWRAAGFGPWGEVHEHLNEDMYRVLLEYFDLWECHLQTRLEVTPPEVLLQASHSRKP